MINQFADHQVDGADHWLRAAGTVLELYIVILDQSTNELYKLS